LSDSWIANPYHSAPTAAYSSFYDVNKSSLGTPSVAFERNSYLSQCPPTVPHPAAVPQGFLYPTSQMHGLSSGCDSMYSGNAFNEYAALPSFPPHQDSLAIPTNGSLFGNHDHSAIQLDPASPSAPNLNRVQIRPLSRSDAPSSGGRTQRPRVHCPQCDKSVSRASDLPRHMMKHLGKKRTCPFCLRQLDSTRPDKIKSHLIHGHKIDADVAQALSRECD
jgi:hypothetical protein